MASPTGRPVRVAHVIARLNVGGPAALVLAVADGLDPARYRSIVLHGAVGQGEASWLDVRAQARATRLVPVAGLRPDIVPADEPRALARLVSALRRVRPDIVHTHTAKAGALGRTAAVIAGVPHVVHTFHGHLLEGYFGPRGRRAVVAVERRLAARTDRIVTVGAKVRDDLLAAGIGRPDQYRVIPPGIDALPPVDPRVARRRLGVPEGVPVVAWVGRLTAIKRPHRAVAAMRQLAARHRAHLLVAGAGELADQVAADTADLPGGATLLGWTSDVAGVLAAADLVLLTSDNEGMPVTLVEAAHAGRPAVTTRAGSAPEVVTDGVTGLVVDPDPSALADAMALLLDDPDRRVAMGRAAAVQAGSRMTTSSMVAAHAALYDEVMDS